MLGGCVATVVLAALLVVASPSLVGAASITVGSGCSLADAITAANTDAASGGCAAGSGADVITLAGDVTLTADLPEITSDITINGGGHKIDGGDAHRAFRIKTPRVTVRFNNLTVTRSRTANDGGAIDIGTGNTGPAGVTVALNGVILESNYSTRTGGGLACGKSGVPTKVSDTNERISVTIDNSVFKNNEGHRGGGAVIAVWGCTVTVNRSAFYGNTVSRAGRTGGAFELLGRGYQGGGLPNPVRHEAVLNVTNSTIFGNTAPGGGALRISESLVRLKHVTITDNTSTNTSDSGSAIYQSSNQTTYRETRFHVENSIVYGNNGRHDCYQFRALKTNVGNMIGSGNCGAGTNPVSGDPQLSAEPSSSAIPFYSLREGSPAVDAVTCLAGVTVDQLGEARPNPGSTSATPCDVGAIEFWRPSTVSFTANGPLVEGGSPVTVTARVVRPVVFDTGVHVTLGGTATFGGSMKETAALNAGALALLRRVAPNHRLLNLPPPSGSDYWTPGEGISVTHGVGQLTIPAGQTTKSFQVTVLPDTVTDPDETVTVDAMLRGPDDPPNCVTGEGGTVCTAWAGRFFGEKAETLTLTIADRPATAGEQQNSPPPQNQQPQPQIPQPAEPQPQTGQPQPQPASPQPEPGEPEPAPNPVPQPEPEPEPVDPQPEPDPQPQLADPQPQPEPQSAEPDPQPDPQPQQQQQERQVELPHAVTDLTLTATAKTVTVSWQTPTTGGAVERFIVQLKAPRGEKGKNRRVDGTKTTTTFRNLTPGVTYKIKVRALNDAGKSQRVTATVTTPQTQ